MRFRYTHDQIEWLRREYPQQLLVNLTDAFNAKFDMDKTPQAIKSTLKNHSITCGRPTGSPKGTLHKWTREQFEFIANAYKSMTIEQIHVAYNKEFNAQESLISIRACTRNHKMLSGRTGQFERGESPWNKGTIGVMRSNVTSFAKGHRPHNWQPVGTRRISHDGYIEIKIKEPRTWKAKHLLTWERHYGPVPEGMMIKFKDGNKTYCAIDNLELVSRAENMILNQMKYSDLPEELKESARLVAKVTIKNKEATNAN